MTTLHSGGKFGGKAYETSGGLHGVGSSVVNALSDRLEVEVAREKRLWKQSYSQGKPLAKLLELGSDSEPPRHHDPLPSGPRDLRQDPAFGPARLYRLCRSKAYLFRGVEIRWSCDPALLAGVEGVPAEAVLHFPGGLRDSLEEDLGDSGRVLSQPWAGEADFRQPGRPRRMGLRLAGNLPAASSTVTATPCRPRTAAPMRRGSVPRC